MKARIISALLLSIVLVGGATWFRFMPENTVAAELVAINNMIEASSGEEVSAEDFFKTDTASASAQSLDEIDLISRQFFTDYMDLKSKNQASSENLGILAEQYATALLEEGGGAYITSDNLTVIADTKQNLIDYNQKVSATRTKYENMTENMSPKKEFDDISDPAFTVFLNLVSANYKKAADELTILEVPVSLAENHLRLVNNYLSSSRAARAISKIETNPISALAALKTQAENSEEEEALVANIKVLLMSKGLYSNEL